MDKSELAAELLRRPRGAGSCRREGAANLGRGPVGGHGGEVRQHLHQVRFSSANVPSAPRSCEGNANLWSWHHEKLLLKLG